jgi:hypothetical protein
MRLVFSRKVHIVVLVCSISLLPLQQIIAANPYAGGNKDIPLATGQVVRDIALATGGVMKGQVVDARGTACRDVPVHLVRVGSSKEEIATKTTDAKGCFEFAGVAGGVYRVETPGAVSVYRAWVPDTAPPSASRAALVVQGNQAVRGNLGAVSPLGWALIAIGVAAAVAIPIALDDDDDAS